MSVYLEKVWDRGGVALSAQKLPWIYIGVVWVGRANTIAGFDLSLYLVLFEVRFHCHWWMKRSNGAQKDVGEERA